jgi:hypothetical protein
MNGILGQLTSDKFGIEEEKETTNEKPTYY